MVKGGRIMGFAALTVVGDGDGGGESGSDDEDNDLDGDGDEYRAEQN